MISGPANSGVRAGMLFAGLLFALLLLPSLGCQFLSGSDSGIAAEESVVNGLVEQVEGKGATDGLGRRL